MAITEASVYPQISQAAMDLPFAVDYYSRRNLEALTEHNATRERGSPTLHTGVAR